MTINQALLNAVEVEQQNQILRSLDQDEPYAYFIAFKVGENLQKFGQLDAAIEAYKKSITINPDFAETHSNMGLALTGQGKLEEAIEAYNKALTINPDSAAARCNLGLALATQGKLKEAIEAYQQSLSLNPNSAETHNNMGLALTGQGKLEEAIEAYNKSLSLKPDYKSVRSQKLFQQAIICDWDGIIADRLFIPNLGISGKFIEPFSMLNLEDAPERHRIRSERYTKYKYPQQALTLTTKVSKRPKRIRIGYFSTDFKNHPVGYLIVKIIEQHNRDEFEVFGYSLLGSGKSAIRQRLESAFDSFTDVQGMDDIDIALRARKDKIDIAIDLNGYTKNCRTSIFAYRAAPIQINYLGYPGTMGADFIDYIVADQNLIPKDSQIFYTEKPIYLPHQFQAQDDELEISAETPTRSNLGLPEKGFVFCAINNTYKISPAEFDIWMRLLQEVDGSVLWLLDANKWSTKNLLKEASSRGVSSERLVFSKRVPHAKYLSQFRQANLYLDTFNYNAGVTASNALWAGLPVLTNPGRSYASRMASSLLRALDISELITSSELEYEKLALELAQNPIRLASIKEKLAANRLSKPLFNSKLFTKNLENGYEQAYQNYLSGGEIDTIIVPK